MILEVVQAKGCLKLVIGWYPSHDFINFEYKKGRTHKLSVSLFVSERISLSLTLNDLGFRMFCMKLNILLSRYHVSMLCHILFHVKNYRCDIFIVRLSFIHCSFMRQRMIGSCSLTLHPHFSVNNIPFYSK